MSITDDVVDLISSTTGVKKEKLKPNALIEDDLGVTGDDAWELMEEIHKKFNVDFSDFEFSLHFGSEVGWHVAEEYGYYPVSVGHLIDVVKNKKWNLPLRNQEHHERYIHHNGRWLIYKLLFFIGLIALAIYKETCTSS